MTDIPDDLATPKSKPGPPSDFKPEYIAVAKQLCKMGASDFELAAAFEVDRATVHRWRLWFPDFEKASRVGKMECDKRVERSLYERAMGYTYESEKIVTRSVGEGVSIIERVPVKMHVPPSETAAVRWLENRQRKTWVVPKEGAADANTSNTLRIVVEGGFPLDYMPEKPPKESKS